MLQGARTYPADKPCRQAVLVIGEDGQQGCMEWLSQAIESEGFAVYTPRLCTQASGWNEVLYQARRQYCAIRERYEQVYVVGLSAGATLALIVAQQYSVDGLVCLSAPLRLKPGALAQHLIRTGGQIGFPLRGSLYRLTHQARDNLFAITCRTLVMQSTDDPFLSPASARRICRDISTPDKQLIWLHFSRHLVTKGPERALLLSAILAFLRADR